MQGSGFLLVESLWAKFLHSAPVIAHILTLTEHAIFIAFSSFKPYPELSRHARFPVLRYHIIDVQGVLENSVLSAYNCLSTLITCIEQILVSIGQAVKVVGRHSLNMNTKEKRSMMWHLNSFLIWGNHNQSTSFVFQGHGSQSHI